MNLKSEIRRLRLLWIALNAFALSFLSFDGASQSYRPYIGLHVKGDTVGIDTAVVMDVRSYRIIRNYNKTSDELIASKITLIGALEKQVELGDSLTSVLRSQVSAMQYSIDRKDALTEALNASFEKLADTNARTVNEIESVLNKKTPFFADKNFWLGMGLGAVLGILLTR